jgi:hypothetical protein
MSFSAKHACSLREVFYVTRNKYILNSLSEEANGRISLHLRRRAAIKLTIDKGKTSCFVGGRNLSVSEAQEASLTKYERTTFVYC